MDSEFFQQSIIFRALSDPNRIAIVNQLTKGEKCACVLLENLNLTQSGLSYHMKILCDSGLVSGRQDGKWVHYSIRPEGIKKAMKILEEFITDCNGGCSCRN